MLFAKIGTQNRRIGCVELRNAAHLKDGFYRYECVYSNEDKVRIEFDVRHKRDEGALRLLEKAFRRARRLVDEFYSYPEDKVRDGRLMKSSDVPERYRKAFGKWLGIATMSLLDGEMAFNLEDLEGFLQNRRNGFVPMWD